MPFRFAEDERVPTWKIATLQYLVAVLLLALVGGYWRLQIGRHYYYQEQAERNRIRNLPVIAPRGRILDRGGRVLVDNFPAFSVLLLRETSATLPLARIEGIARGLNLDPAELTKLIERTAQLPRFQPVVLKQSATLEDIAFVESHRLEYPELDLIQVQQRLYPKHEVAAAALGYVGEVSEEVIAKPGSPYRPGDVVGKSGIEREYNSVLSGRDGLRRVIVNSKGQEVGSMTTINALPGNDIRLTLDLDVQVAAESALGEQPGAVVAVDPRTGEVLAMVSHPSFDPNDFARRIDKSEWEQLIANPLHPLMNQAIQAHLAPGSVFKVVTAAAALETGTIQPTYSLYCPGEVTFYGHTYHDWVWEKHQGHGHVDLHRALVVSCDVYFYTLGKMLGIDKIDTYAQGLGLGARTGVDLPGEDPGLMPSPEWVQRVFKRKWWAGETISVATGQGAVAVTPLQIASTIGGIVEGGVFHRPHLAFPQDLEAPPGRDSRWDDARKFPLRESTVDTLSKAMWGVVNESGGTGAGAHLAALDICGKTGTAQVVSAKLQDSAHKSEYNNNAWFVGYAPGSNPEIVVAALVMQGGHSSVATPVAREVIKAYFDKHHPGLASPQPAVTTARVVPQAGHATRLAAAGAGEE